MHEIIDSFGFNDFYDYSCECGQVFGKYLMLSKCVCKFCNTEVTYRPNRLPRIITIDGFYDCVYKNDKSKLICIAGDKWLNRSEMRVIELATTVFIYYNGIFYLIKDRRPITYSNGKVNYKATYGNIKRKLYHNIVPTENFIYIVEDTPIENRNYVIKID